MNKEVWLRGHEAAFRTIVGEIVYGVPERGTLAKIRRVLQVMLNDADDHEIRVELENGDSEASRMAEGLRRVLDEEEKRHEAFMQRWRKREENSR